MDRKVDGSYSLTWEKAKKCWRVALPVRGLRRLESSTDTELDKLERTSSEKQTV